MMTHRDALEVLAANRRDQVVVRQPLTVLLGGERMQLPPDVVGLRRELESDRLAM